MAQTTETRLFIGGTWRAAATGERIDVVNPATGVSIGSVSCAGAADLAASVDAAQSGFELWRATPPFDRYMTMRRAARLIEERIETIAALLTEEQGKPIEQARAEIRSACGLIDYFAEEARRLDGRLVAGRMPAVANRVTFEPIGPVAAFTPWNFPISQIIRKIAPALAAGCSIIVKAPEETPRAPAAVIQAFADAGLPAGAIGLVFGVPAEISAYLIRHPVIRKVSFTGSTSVGRMLAAMAGEAMKPATMELGGHGPAIVCADADVAKAIEALAMAKSMNAGQVCVSPTRFLVHSSIEPAFTDAFAKRLEALVVGNGSDPGTQVGPLANPRRLDAMESLIHDAVDRGARVVTGGKRIGNQGNFFQPTVLADLSNEMRVMNEEPFGPIALMCPFDHIDDAIAEANRLPYGLAAYLFTNSARQASVISQRVQAGMIGVNHLGIGPAELPFGGIRDSGFGTEGGPEAVKAYTTMKLVSSRWDD